MLSTDAVMSAASDLLGNRLGGQPHLSDPEDLGGAGSALVLRARVATNPFLHERTVIIKQLPPESLSGPDPALVREIVAYNSPIRWLTNLALVRSCWHMTWING